MCLAIFKPKGLTIPKESLMAGYACNRSGCGFIYHENGKLHTFKKLVPFTEFYDEYCKIEENHDVAVHFRAATHGPVNDENCHPFVMCRGKFAMIHNGIFRVPLIDRSLSDTGNFCKIVLEPAIKNGTYRDLSKDSKFSKYALEDDNRWGWGTVVLMSADGEITIYKEKNGDWDDGIWYSNNCYKYGQMFRDRDETELVPYSRNFAELEWLGEY